MRNELKVACAAAAVAWASLSHAQMIDYEGSIAIPPGGTVAGTVTGLGWAQGSAINVDFWSLFGYGGATIQIRGTRLSSALDPALALYSGLTFADQSEFRTGQSWGGMQYLASANNEVPSSTGPFGDPLLTITLPFSGFYTIAIGGDRSSSDAAFGYTLTVTAVPEPAPAAMLLAGIAAMGWMKLRRRSKKG